MSWKPSKLLQQVKQEFAIIECITVSNVFVSPLWSTTARNMVGSHSLWRGLSIPYAIPLLKGGKSKKSASYSAEDMAKINAAIDEAASGTGQVNYPKLLAKLPGLSLRVVLCFACCFLCWSHMGEWGTFRAWCAQPM
jgi:hypothetical protein